MVAAAEPLLVVAGWLPTLLRTAKATDDEPDGCEAVAAQPGAVEGNGGALAASDAAQALDVAEASTPPDPAEPLLDDAEPLDSLDGVGQSDPVQSQAEAEEVEALLPVAD